MAPVILTQPTAFLRIPAIPTPLERSPPSAECGIRGRARTVRVRIEEGMSSPYVTLKLWRSGFIA
jgi:hypothetical protein